MRKKLIEILETVVSPKELLCDGEVLVSTARVADHLIANGVTVQKCGRWVKYNFLGHEQWACSECQTLGSPQWKRCPVCEAKMIEPPKGGVTMMPSSELIKILRTGAQGLDPSARFLILDACDRLERQIRDNELLMQKIVELRSRGKWIPVTERLPEKNKRVIAFRKGKDGELVFWAKYSQKTWFDMEWNVCRYGVTHWMELPEPPKGE